MCDAFITTITNNKTTQFFCTYRVGASPNTPSNIVGAVNPSTLERKGQVNKQLCKTCRNRHSCKHLNNCDSCNRWCSASDIDSTTLPPNEIALEPIVGVPLIGDQLTVSLASRTAAKDEDNDKIPYTIVTLQTEPIKDTLADLFGIENKKDVDKISCFATTLSNDPPIVSNDNQAALKSSNSFKELLENQNDPNEEIVELAEDVRQQMKEALEKKIQDYGKDVIAVEDIGKIINEVDADVSTFVEFNLNNDSNLEFCMKKL